MNLFTQKRGEQNLVVVPELPQWAVLDDRGLAYLRLMIEQGLTPSDVVLCYRDELPEEVQQDCLDLLQLFSPDLQGAATVRNALTDRSMIAMVAVTNRCNLRCPHCYVDACQGREQELSVDDHAYAAQVLTAHLATDNQAGYRVNLTGGEPFVRTDVMAIIDAYHQYGIEVKMSTNGLLITQEQMDQLAARSVTLQISLDGSQAATHDAIRGPGTFVRIVEQIRRLRKAGVKVGINHLVQADSIDELEETVRLAAVLGCSGFNPINLVQLGRACDSRLKRVSEAKIFRRIAKLLIDQPELRPLFERTSLFSSLGAALLSGVTCLSCGVGNRPCVYIDPEGEVFPCANTQKPEFRLGNVRVDLPAALAWNHPVLARLRELEVDSLNPKCSACAVRRFCGGDCRGETYNVTGDLRAPYVACADRFESLIELMWVVADHSELFESRAEEYLRNAALV